MKGNVWQCTMRHTVIVCIKQAAIMATVPCHTPLDQLPSLSCHSDEHLLKVCWQTLHQSLFGIRKTPQCFGSTMEVTQTQKSIKWIFFHCSLLFNNINNNKKGIELNLFNNKIFAEINVHFVGKSFYYFIRHWHFHHWIKTIW